MSDPIRHPFGDKLREVRERRHMTLKEVAERAALSESMISQIERNKVSPAIDTLITIAEILELDLEYLFADLKRDRTVHLVRREERQKLILPKVRYEQLSRTLGGDEAGGMEAYLLEVDPGGEKASTGYGHVGKELGIVLAGSGAFRIGSKTWELAEGDSISFSSDVPHALRNTGKALLRAFWVVTPPRGVFKGESRSI
jgi:transcriptional regulator with XRE-family HTH domain